MVVLLGVAQIQAGGNRMEIWFHSFAKFYVSVVMPMFDIVVFRGWQCFQ